MSKRKRPKRFATPIGWFAYSPSTGAVHVGQGDAPAGASDMYIRLMPEYGVDVPLWGCDWEALGLSEHLVADLTEWQRAFDEAFDPSGADRSGWKAIEGQWERDARSLAARLRREIPSEFELVVDLWPLDSTGDGA